MSGRHRATRAPAALLLAALLPGGAWAHAFLRTATPTVGSTVAAAPAAVALTFTEALEPAFSDIAVTDAAGRRVDRGSPTGDGERLAVALGPLPPGRYQVTWHVTSIDTHHTEGSFAFTVAP